MPKHPRQSLSFGKSAKTPFTRESVRLSAPAVKDDFPEGEEYEANVTGDEILGVEGIATEYKVEQGGDNSAINGREEMKDISIKPDPEEWEELEVKAEEEFWEDTSINSDVNTNPLTLEEVPVPMTEVEPYNKMEAYPSKGSSRLLMNHNSTAQLDSESDTDHEEKDIKTGPEAADKFPASCASSSRAAAGDTSEKWIGSTSVMNSDNITICSDSHCSLAPYQDIEPLRALLPECYQYTVCKYSVTADGIHAVFRMDITTTPKALNWIEEFKKHTETTLRVEKKKKATGQKLVFGVKLRCHHNTKPKSKTADKRHGSKNTGCPATMEVVVKQTPTIRKSRSNDVHATAFPMMVQLNFTHNHPIHCALVLKHRDVSNEVKKIFINFYECLHSPSSALQAYKYDLLEEYGEDFPIVSADRAKYPDLQWCFRLYYEIFKKKYGEPDDAQMLAHLKKVIDTHNTTDSKTAKMSQVGNNICISFCSPLMKCIHSYVRQSGELVFIDGSGGVDRHGCRVFLMMTHSAAGGLPLGVLITSSDSERVLTQGFQLLKDLLPSNSFFGKHEKGPEIIVTSDTEAEHKALHTVFPESRLLLSSFHTLRAMWCYLWNAKHKIKKEDRLHIFKAFKCMFYAKTEVDLDRYYDELCVDEKTQQYKCLVNYFKRLYQRRTEWGFCFRDKLPVRGNNTHNFCETAMRVMKDKIFYRTKTFNVVQLVDFLFTRLDKVYRCKLLDVANMSKQSLNSHYVSIANWDLPQSKITQVSSHEFIVPSESNPDLTYTVDMDVAMCSCPVGNNGGPCQHQHIVAKYFSIGTINTDPITSPHLRKVFYRIATGEYCFQLLPKTSDDIPAGLTQDNESSASTCMESGSQSNMDLPLVYNGSIREETVSEIEQNIDEMSRILKERTNANPDMFHEPVRELLKNLKNINTEALLISAMKTF